MIIKRNKSIVLGLFSGIGLLDMGFEAAGFCVVRGPDILWGSDIRDFNGQPLCGHINGVIAGVPCQRFSAAVSIKNREEHPDLWPEFWRIVDEVMPQWCLAECVPGAENQSQSMLNVPDGWHPSVEIISCDELGSAQRRKRMFLWAGPDEFWKDLKTNGYSYGFEWRKQIGRGNDYQYRTIMGDGTAGSGANILKYATITGDSLEPRNSSTGKSARYIKGDDLLDAFDLPKGWGIPPHMRISRGSEARLITQGVPVAAAYALAKAVGSAAV